MREDELVALIAAYIEDMDGDGLIIVDQEPVDRYIANLAAEIVTIWTGV